MASSSVSDSGSQSRDLASAPLESLTKNPWVILFAALMAGGTGGSFLGHPDPTYEAELKELENFVREDVQECRESQIVLRYQIESIQLQLKWLEDKQ